MDFKLVRLAMASALFSAPAVSALEALNAVSPYVGVEAQWRHMNFEKGMGDNLWRRDLPQGTLLAGLKFHQNWAMEAGYGGSVRTSKTTLINPGAFVIGIPAETPTQYISNIRTTTAHLDLVGSCPLSFAPSVNWVGVLGVEKIKLTLKRKTNLLYSPSAHIFINVASIDPLAVYARKSKYVARLGTGLEKSFTDYFSLRALVLWENTRKLRWSASAPGVQPTYTIKAKDTISYGLGAFYKF